MDHPTTVPENANMTEAPTKFDDANVSRAENVTITERDLVALVNLLETAQPPGYKDVGTAGFRRSLSGKLERQFYDEKEEGPFDEEFLNQVPEEDDEPDIDTHALDKAQDAVYGRDGEYGSPEDNFATIAGFWQEYLHAKQKSEGSVTIEAQDVAYMMVLLKVSRASNGSYNLDNDVDIAGYAESSARIANE